MTEEPLSLAARIEALLFIAPESISIQKLSSSLSASPDAIQAALSALATSLQDRGIRLQQHNELLQLVTAPEAAADVERFLSLDTEETKLSRAALETLAIVAFKQPITRSRIAAVRGVNSDSVVRTLVNLGLIEEVGRQESVGRPILYGTTLSFLQYFGLESLEQLPPLSQTETKIMAESLERALTSQ